MISCGDEASVPDVIYNKSPHAFKIVAEILLLAITLIESSNSFRVAVTFEIIFFAKLFTDFRIIVDFAINNINEVLIWGEKGLTTLH
jgi:hypothetical protein